MNRGTIIRWNEPVTTAVSGAGVGAGHAPLAAAVRHFLPTASNLATGALVLLATKARGGVRPLRPAATAYLTASAMSAAAAYIWRKDFVMATLLGSVSDANRATLLAVNDMLDQLSRDVESLRSGDIHLKHQSFILNLFLVNIGRAGPRRT